MNQDRTFTEKLNYRYTKNYKARNKNFKREEWKIQIFSRELQLQQIIPKKTIYKMMVIDS